MRKLSFITLNVRGLNASRKTRAIFRQLHNKKASVIFLQETYNSPDQEKIWSNKWGSKIYFCHGSKHAQDAEFVWNGKKPKIKRDTLIGPKGKGGLDLPEYEIITKSLLSAWVMRMKDGVNEDWMKIPSFYLKKVGGVLIFDCNCDLKLLELNNMPVFYIDILKTWAEIQGIESNFQDQHNIREVII